MRDYVAWLNETPGSIALRESLFMWPIIEATHVVTIMLFVGTIIMVDLRLIGVGFRQVKISEMMARILPWTVAGFIIMATTGLLLVYAKPTIYYHSLFFRLKMAVLLLALANIVLFYRSLQRNVVDWDQSVVPPIPVRTSAMISLSAWIAIIITGRMIAYDWFNCEKLTPGGTLSALASCPA